MSPRVLAASLALTLVAGVAVPASATVECHGVTVQSSETACPRCQKAQAEAAKSQKPLMNAACCTVQSAPERAVAGSPDQSPPVPAAAAIAKPQSVAVLRWMEALTPRGSACDPAPPPLQRVLPLLD